MPKISKLIIDQQFAQVGIKITPAQMQITTPRRQMKINEETPQMKIENDTPTFVLDTSQIRAETGRMSPNDLLKALRSKSEAAATNYIGETVAEGDYAGKLEQPGNRVTELIRNKTLEPSNTSINIASTSSPEVSWNKGGINVSWSNHTFNIEWDGEYTPEVVIDPRCSVEIFLRNRPSITITVEEYEASDYAGRMIDATL